MWNRPSETSALPGPGFRSRVLERPPTPLDDRVWQESSAVAVLVPRESKTETEAAASHVYFVCLPLYLVSAI